MGEFATTVQSYLRDALAEGHPGARWEVEYPIAGTPVDVAGVDEDTLYLVELEWRRADPADNAAKLFRHIDAGAIGRAEVVVFHVFTNYYDLSSGGVSTKRRNAEFVGRLAEERHEAVTYVALDFDLEPPKRGGDWPDSWRGVADDVVGAIGGELGGG